MQAEAHQRVSMLETMMLMRAHERVLAVHMGRPAASGGEAVALAVGRLLDDDDCLVIDPRRAGALIARGASPDRLLADALGRSGGYAPRGALRTEVAELGAVFAEDGGAAIAFAPAVVAERRRDDPARRAIGVVLFGDGEACDDVVEEAMRLAQQQRSPLLFVCEALAWQAGAMLTAERLRMPTQRLAGDDVEAILDAGGALVQAMRNDGKPRLLVLGRGVTARRGGDDLQAHVDAELIAEHTLADPIAVFTSRLIDDGVTSPGELLHLHLRTEASAEAALAHARNAPPTGLRRPLAALEA